MWGTWNDQIDIELNGERNLTKLTRIKDCLSYQAKIQGLWEINMGTTWKSIEFEYIMQKLQHRHLQPNCDHSY